MSSYTGLSPKDPNKYLGPNLFLSTVVTRNRSPTGADIKNPANGAYYRTGSFWLTGPNPTTGFQGDLWYLSKIVANVAYWLEITGSLTGPLLQIAVQATNGIAPNPVNPTGGGIIGVSATVVAPISIPAITRTNLDSTFTVEIQRAIATGVSSNVANGLSHFNSAHFSVDANGFVSLIGGGSAIDSITVQATSGAGTNPVVPNPATGDMTVSAALVAATGVPAQTKSTAANSYTVEIQTSKADATATNADNGLAHFSSTDFTVTSTGFVQSKTTGPSLGVKNIGFTYNAGTGVFTVCAADGSALSAANPGYVTLNAKSNSGQTVTIAVTANQSFIDDTGASEIIGNLFGLTTAVAVTVDIPFFLYAVSNDSENAIAFMISRFPGTLSAPVAAKIGKPSSAIANTQGSFFSIDDITQADYESNPCLCIGSFRMRMSAADDWTVQPLAFYDGVGHFQNGTQFSVPRGQFGAAAGKFFKNNGGTAPDDSAGAFIYSIDFVNIRINYKLAFPSVDTAGVGAVTAILAMPFNSGEGSITGFSQRAAAGVYTFMQNEIIPFANNMTFPYISDTTNGLSINTDFGVGVGVAVNGNMLVYFS